MAVEFEWHGVQAVQAVQEAAQQGLRDTAEAVLTEANKHVPHDVGTLETSGHTWIGDDYAVVYYDTAYAVRLHEHPEYHFQGAPTRGGKWLENATKLLAGRFTAILGTTIKRRLGG